MVYHLYDKIDRSSHIETHVSKCRSRSCHLRQSVSDTSTCRSVDEDYVNSAIGGYLLELLRSKCWQDERMRVILCIYLYKVNQPKMFQRIRRIPIKDLCGRMVVMMIDKLVDQETLRDETQSIVDEKVAQFEEGLVESVKHTVRSMKALLAEVKEKKLRVVSLEREGAQCYTAIQQIKKQFFRFSKYTSTSTRLTDFCLQLFENILQQAEYTQKIIKILKKRSQSATEQQEKLKQSEPMLVCSEAGVILSVNSQCCKFLKKLKHDLYNKSLLPYLFPQPPTKFHELMQQNLNKPYYCLIRRAGDDIVPINMKVVKTKKEYTIRFRHINKVKKSLFILLDPAGDICFMQPKKYNISSTINIDMRELYEREAKGMLDLMQENTLQPIHKQFGKIIISMVPFMYPTYRMLKFTVCRNEERVSIHNRNSSKVCIKPNRFQYNFDFYQKPMYIGMEGYTTEQQSNFYALTNLMKYTMVQKSYFDYSKNIKSYRLVNDRLFCIELQPTDEQLLKNEAILNEDRWVQQNYKAKHTSWYSVLLVVLILLFFGTTATSLYLQVDYTTGRAKAATAINRIHTFQIHFQRVVCLLRDALINTPVWTQQAISLIRQLPALQKTRLFLQKNIQTTFEGRKFNGCLDQLCDIVVNRIYQVVANNQLQPIPSILAINAQLIMDEIQNQKMMLLSRYNQMMDVANIGLYVKIASIGFIYSLFSVLLYLLNKSQERIREEELMHFRLMGDDYLNSMAERLDRFQLFFEMSQKNEDIDIFNQLTDEKIYRERTKPKEVAYCASDRWKGTVISILTTLFIIGMFISTFISLTDIYRQEKDGVKAGYAISETYASILRSSVDKKVDRQQVRKHTENLQTLQVLMNEQLFEQQFQSVLKEVFFGNACGVLPDKIGDQCGDSLYERSNPFKYGLLFYFNNLFYNFIDGSGEVQLATGQKGKALYNIFEYISDAKQKEIERRSNEVVEKSKGLVVIEVFLGILMIFQTLVDYLTHRKRSTVNEQILTVLKWPQEKVAEEAQVESDGEVE